MGEILLRNQQLRFNAMLDKKDDLGQLLENLRSNFNLIIDKIKELKKPQGEMKKGIFRAFG